MRILKEDTVIAKETLPVSFLTDMISKGWDEVGYLKEASSAIKETYKDTAKIEGLMQDLMDAYLVFIGQVESYLHTEEDIVADFEPVEEKDVDKELEADPEMDTIITEPKPSLPEANIDVEPIIEPSLIEADPERPIEEPVARAKEEPFEFFVDFDEPDMSERRITDDDLYGHEDSEFEHNRLRAQLID